MKKLSLTLFLTEIEKHKTELGKLPRKKSPPSTNTFMNRLGNKINKDEQTQSVNNDEMQNKIQNDIDKQDNMEINPSKYEEAKRILQQYTTDGKVYNIPQDVAEQLGKKFGSLDDAGIEIFGNEGDQQFFVQGKSNVGKINSDVQKAKTNPKTPLSQYQQVPPEEEQEISQFGTTKTGPGIGLPKNAAEMQTKYKQAIQAGKPIEVWDPKTQQYASVDPQGKTPAETSIANSTSQTQLYPTLIRKKPEQDKTNVMPSVVRR